MAGRNYAYLSHSLRRQKYKSSPKDQQVKCQRCNIENTKLIFNWKSNLKFLRVKAVVDVGVRIVREKESIAALLMYKIKQILMSSFILKMLMSFMIVHSSCIFWQE
jgi:hypothetical protein